MAFGFKGKITKDLILSKVSEKDIFERYLGLTIIQGRYYKSPFRVDDHEGCLFYISNGTDRLRFRDTSRGTNYDCFDFVRNLPHLNLRSFIETLEKIATDFNITGEVDKISYIVEEPSLFSEGFEKIETTFVHWNRDWYLNDYTYWQSQGISKETLKKYYVYPVHKIEMSRNQVKTTIYYHSWNDPCYAYYLGKGEYKYYFPKRTKEDRARGKSKFIQKDADTIQGWYLLPSYGEVCVITKSYKDVMALGELHIPAIAPQSEVVTVAKPLINYEIFNVLSERFDRILVLGDNDLSGISFLRWFKNTYGIEVLMFPRHEPKDFTDNIRAFGKEEMQRKIMYLAKRLNYELTTRYR